MMIILSHFCIVFLIENWEKHCSVSHCIDGICFECYGQNRTFVWDLPSSGKGKWPQRLVLQSIFVKPMDRNSVLFGISHI